MSDVNTIGRRKTAVARLYLREGKKRFLVNGRKLGDYFPPMRLQQSVLHPVEALSASLAGYSVQVRVSGGGFRGQAEAIRLAMARAMVVLDPEHKPILRREGLITRDPRMVERKKYGRRKARRRFQFSKR